MSKRHHIQRVEHRRCWLVICRRSPRLFRKYFHDRRYGSKATGLVAAIAYRDRLLAAMPDWRLHQHHSSRNKSGIIGAFLSVQRQKGRVDQYWTAWWKEDGHYRRRAFSVSHYGQRRAKALAVALRRAKVAAARPEPPALPRPPLSNTGVLGVCRRIIADVPVYVATWREHGKQRMQSFSTRRYGNARALDLAIKARRAHEKPLPEGMRPGRGRRESPTAP